MAAKSEPGACSSSVRSSSVRSSSSDAAGGLDLAWQLISSRLDHPYVPGAMHLSSICRAWRAAAGRMRGLSITWPTWPAKEDAALQVEAAHHQRQLARYESYHRRYNKQQQPQPPPHQQQQQHRLRAFTTWLDKGAAQLVSFTVEVTDVHRKSDICAIWAALTSAATAAAAAGNPLPLQELRVPLQQLQLPDLHLAWGGSGNPPSPPGALLAALPGLRRLCMPLEVAEYEFPELNYWDDPSDEWEEEQEVLAAQARAAAAAATAFFNVLPGMSQLQDLEVVMRPWAAMGNELPQAYWRRLLTAAPKQLQLLCLRVLCRHQPQQGQLQLSYDWAPLAAFTQLRRLRVDNIAAGVDLAPVALLPALEWFSTQQPGAAKLEQLVPLKRVLHELEVGRIPADQHRHLKQLTRLTSLTLAADNRPSCALPGQVAAGLRRLDWTLGGNTSSSRATSLSLSSSSSSSSSSSGGLLAGCSSANLRDLQLRGQGWDRDAAAAAAVKQLTGLTAFGLHASYPRRQIIECPWLGLYAVQPLRQLRSLSLPFSQLAPEQPWLGQLPHLTRLCTAAHAHGQHSRDRDKAWPAEEVLWLRPQQKQRLQANLRSCAATLKVLEFDLELIPQTAFDQQAAHSTSAAVKAALQQELPGVYVLVRGHVWRKNWDYWYRTPAVMEFDYVAWADAQMP